MANRGKKQRRAKRPGSHVLPASPEAAPPSIVTPLPAAAPLPPGNSVAFKLPSEPNVEPAPLEHFSPRSRTPDIVIGLLLAAAVFLVFGQTASHEFVNFDDNEYVYENREIKAGITLHGVRAAFTRLHGVNWHPLTTLSHMFDCQIYGLWAGGHHLTNVILHALTSVLLYIVLRQMTGRLASSAMAAFLFAVHPLRVESVAWVAERKDVLGGLFFVLTLLAYAAYVRKPSSLLRTLLLPYVFALGLMCKPMLVTTPLVLLLLDYWPLRRWNAGIDGHVPAETGALRFRALLAEKLPLFILCAWSCAITLIAQASAMPSVEHIAIGRRLANALLAYVDYLKLFIWPVNLAVYYPYAAGPPGVLALSAAIALVAGISLAAWKLRRTRPYFIVGWLWFLGMLVPVIGLIQVGNQSLADRYTYLPMIGPAVALVWLIADLAGRSRVRRLAFTAAGSIALTSLAACAAWQTTFWRNDFTLWTRAVECTQGNYMARMHLGQAWAARGRFDEAVKQYDEALAALPDYIEAHFNLGSALSSLDRADEAQRQFEAVLRLRPDHALAHNNLGMLFLTSGNIAAAADHFQQAVDLNPSYAVAHNNLGITQMVAGDYASAVDSYHQALALDPDFVQSHANLGRVLGKMGQSAEAVAELRFFLGKQSDNATVQGWLAWVLATARENSIRDGRAALELARHASAVTHSSDPSILDALAAAYAETGQFDEATKVAIAARDLARGSGQPKLSAEIEQRIELYRRGQPFRQ